MSSSLNLLKKSLDIMLWCLNLSRKSLDIMSSSLNLLKKSLHIMLTCLKLFESWQNNVILDFLGISCLWFNIFAMEYPSLHIRSLL